MQIAKKKKKYIFMSESTLCITRFVTVLKTCKLHLYTILCGSLKYQNKHENKKIKLI